MSLIAVENFSVRFGANTVLRHVSLSVELEEIATAVGQAYNDRLDNLFNLVVDEVGIMDVFAATPAQSSRLLEAVSFPLKTGPSLTRLSQGRRQTEAVKHFWRRIQSSHQCFHELCHARFADLLDAQLHVSLIAALPFVGVKGLVDQQIVAGLAHRCRLNLTSFLAKRSVTNCADDCMIYHLIDDAYVECDRSTSYQFHI